MDWGWAVDGITDEVPRTTGPECINYMANKRRWLESIFFTICILCILNWAVNRLNPILVPPPKERDKPHSAIRLMLLIAITFIFGIEMGFKFAGKSVIFTMNPCHIQTMVQIYLLASKPSKTTIALFRIQMNNLNGPFLAFLFPEVEYRTIPFEQATYWIQHALLYIIPVYILKSGAYEIEELDDYNWVIIGVMVMLLYHFVLLNAVSIYTGINLNHMLCAALTDPFEGQNYRVAAVIHQSILCPILNKSTVLIFSNSAHGKYQMPLSIRQPKLINNEDEHTTADTTTTAATITTPYHQQAIVQQEVEILKEQHKRLPRPKKLSLTADAVGAATSEISNHEKVVTFDGSDLIHRHKQSSQTIVASVADAIADLSADIRCDNDNDDYNYNQDVEQKQNSELMASVKTASEYEYNMAILTATTKID